MLIEMLVALLPIKTIKLSIIVIMRTTMLVEIVMKYNKTNWTTSSAIIVTLEKLSILIMPIIMLMKFEFS